MRLFSKSQYYGIGLPMMRARKKFREQLQKRPNTAATQFWVLRHDMSNAAEKQSAVEWLLAHGFRQEEVKAKLVASDRG